MIEILKTIWEELEKRGLNKSIESFIRKGIPGIENNRCFIGIQIKTNKRALIFNIKDFSKEYKNILIKNDFLNIILSKTKYNEKNLIILLEDLFYQDIFDIFIEDILECIFENEKNENFFNILINRINKWINFFSNTKKEGLSLQKQIGLYGELYFILNFNDTKQNIFNWKGYDSYDKDFYFEDFGIEVKTTAKKKPYLINISNEKQLSLKGFKKIFLFVLIIEKSFHGNDNLNEIIKKIKNKISNDIECLKMFNNKLLKYGYLESQSTFYKNSFIKLKEYFYEVSKEFPKITENDLKKGIGNIRYSINLSDCNEYQITKEKIISIIKD